MYAKILYAWGKIAWQGDIPSKFSRKGVVLIYGRRVKDVQIFEGRLDKFMNNQEILFDFKACFKFITKTGTVTINYEDLESEAS